jgi:hypothetical protein
VGVQRGTEICLHGRWNKAGAHELHVIKEMGVIRAGVVGIQGRMEMCAHRGQNKPRIGDVVEEMGV